MKYFVVKVKDEDLFFNIDEVEGEFICDTPILLDEGQANSIMSFCTEIYNYDDSRVFPRVYSNEDLEIREVELNLI